MTSLILLLPSLTACATAPHMRQWLARGDRGAEAQSGREAQLRSVFAFAGATIPAAALTRNLDAGDARDALWLRADPAYVMADALTLRLMQSGKMDLSTDEADTFAQALQPLFADSEFTFEATQAQRWYLHGPLDTHLPKFASPDAALGDDLSRHLPSGDNARYWRGLLNEAQIVLTQHPLNTQRARRGLPPVNSVWFWGAGALPQLVRASCDEVYSDDEIAIALAKSVQKLMVGDVAVARTLLESSELKRRLRSGADSPGSSLLIDLVDLRDRAQADAHWFALIDAALKNHTINKLDLRFVCGERYSVKPMHRWRFWRRAMARA